MKVTVEEVVKKYGEATRTHNLFVDRYERSERAYRGVLEPRTGADKWRHKMHPPYAFNLIETIVANTIEENLRFEVRPSPKVNLPLEEAQRLLDQAETIGQLLRHEHRVDDMDSKQRPLLLSAAIGGTGIGKTYWNWLEGPVTKQGVVNREVVNELDEVIGYVPTIEEITETQILRDHSTFEVVDPRDFIVHESAKTLQPYLPGGAQYVIHRCWYSFEQLKTWERAGFVKNVDKLKDTRDHTDEYVDRERQLFNIQRTKDLIEVLEYWCYKDGRVYRTLVGNRDVLLRESEPNPFHHGEYPFIAASTMPGLFSIRGYSEVELIAHLQEMLWELMNQRLDNIELINNMVTLIRSDIDDPEAFEFYPGAKWQVDSLDQVGPYTPPYQLSEVTLSAEALIKGDLQNVTSAAPFASGTDTASVDNTTATGASIVMTAAQKRLSAKKYQALFGFRDEAQHRIKNCQQFISNTKLVHILGEGGALLFKEVSPLDIQGEYLVEMTPMGESMMRQEKRAEALQLGQVLMSMAPVLAATGASLNTKEVVKWMLGKWDVPDLERFFTPEPQPQVAAAVGGGQGGGGGAQPPGMPSPPSDQLEGPNLGITAGSAIDASSPSAAGGISGSPVTALQRALAMGGGVNNA